MPGPWRATALDGVLAARLIEHADDRGKFMELWRDSWTAGLPTPDGDPLAMRQGNLSHSREGVLRGMHFHRRQSDLWVMAEGRALAALADLRALRPGESPAVELHELTVGAALFIPEGVAHGFYARSDMTLIYLVSNEYDGTDEHGFTWDDPDAAIAWPVRAVTLSPRDAFNRPLREVLAHALESAE